MRQYLLPYVSGGLILLGLFFAGGWAYWDAQASANAWMLDEPERILPDVAPHEQVKVSFRLRNTARVPYRILGAETC